MAGGGIGERRKDAKLTAAQVWEIRRIYDANVQGEKRTAICGQMQRWLAKKFNLQVALVKKVVLRVIWRKPTTGMSWEQWEKEHKPDVRDSP